MIHEARRDQLAQPVLAPRPPPGRLRARGMLPEAPDRLDDLRHALAARRDRLQNRRPPVRLAVRLQRQVGLDRRRQPVGALPIRLVHDEDVGDFHDAGLERLHVVAGAGHERDDRHVGRADDVDLVLADADRFDDDDVLAGGVEDERRVAGRAREAAQMPARRHAADEHAFVGRVRLHAQPIAEHGAAAERARGIDGDDADRQRDGARPVSDFGDQPIDERALARAGRAGDADEIRAAGVAENRADQVGARRILVLDQGNRAGHRARVAGEHAVGERHHRASSCRAMTSR